MASGGRVHPRRLDRLQRSDDPLHPGARLAHAPRPTAPLAPPGPPRQFHTSWARGVPALETNDDGPLAPTAAGSAVPFAPEIAIPALITMRETYGSHLFSTYGFRDAFNPTFTAQVPWSGVRWILCSAGLTSIISGSTRGRS